MLIACSDTEMSRSGDFCADNSRTKPITLSLPLAHVRRVMRVKVVEVVLKRLILSADFVRLHGYVDIPQPNKDKHIYRDVCSYYAMQLYIVCTGSPIRPLSSSVIIKAIPINHTLGIIFYFSSDPYSLLKCSTMEELCSLPYSCPSGVSTLLICAVIINVKS